MENVMVFIIFLFTALICYNQTDTLEVVSFSLSECKDSDGCKRESDYRIIKSGFRGDTLNLNLKGIANCSGVHNVQVSKYDKEVFINFEAGAEMEYSSDTIGYSIDKNTKDTTFMIGQIGISSSSDCDCFYDFNFKVLGLKRDQTYHYYINTKMALDPIPKEVMLKDSVEKAKVRRLISDIKEVKYHKSEVRYVICKITPDELDSDYYYQVKVYEEGEYHTKFEFKVYPMNDYQILYSYNFLDLSFEEWRKYREYPQWDEFWDMIDIIKEDRSNAK